MTATISRLYNNYADARDAVRNLEAAGVRTQRYQHHREQCGQLVLIRSQGGQRYVPGSRSRRQG